MQRIVLIALMGVLITGAVPTMGGPSSTFQARLSAINPDQQKKMEGVSWQPGCPVGPDDLTSIHMTYHGFDGAIHEGVLVVHKRVSPEVVAIFHELFDAGFQIERMQPYEDFAIAQYAAHNDSVGFYCRPAQDDPGSLSWHSYGLAIDLNAMTNPFHDPKEGWWPNGSLGDRDRAAPGLVTAQSEVVKIFMRHGWAWGGLDKNADYMHFAKITIGSQSNPLERPVWAERLQYAPDQGAPEPPQ